jgi:transaldolase
MPYSPKGRASGATSSRATGYDAEAIFEALAISNIQGACDLFRPVYDQSDGRDGFVSIEVSPGRAHDTEATVVEARRLWQSVARPNCHDRLASVASFFVSRVDTLVDRLLQERIMAAHGDAATEKRLSAWLGKLAIANANLAYARFREIFDGSRFHQLEKHGARV